MPDFIDRLGADLARVVSAETLASKSAGVTRSRRSQDTRTWRPWLSPPRRWIAGAGAALVLAAGGGIAYATGVFAPTPGGDVVTDLSKPVTVTGTGTQTVQLGAPPAGANVIDFGLSCLSAGDFTFPDGSGLECGSSDISNMRAHPATGTIAIVQGEDGTTITATPGAKWRLTAAYASVATTAWGVNASGQTYGMQNQHGTPDLIAVIATNGRNGYVYAEQLNSPAPKTLSQALADNNAPAKVLTVYQSDGKTPIGVFRTGSGPVATQTSTAVRTSTTAATVTTTSETASTTTPR